MCVQYHRNIVTAEIEISYLIMKIKALNFCIPLRVSMLLLFLNLVTQSCKNFILDLEGYFKVDL